MTHLKKRVIIKGHSELPKLERFVEEICDSYNISNEYFGNINLGTAEAIEILLSKCGDFKSWKVSVEFEKEKEGYMFSFELMENTEFDVQEEDIVDREIRKSKLEKELLILKKIADLVMINEDGKGIKLIFNIDGISFEKSLARMNLLRSFWAKSPNLIHG